MILLSTIWQRLSRSVPASRWHQIAVASWRRADQAGDVEVVIDAQVAAAARDDAVRAGFVPKLDAAGHARLSKIHGESVAGGRVHAVAGAASCRRDAVAADERAGARRR